VKAIDLEANPEETETVAEHQEVLNEEAAVETVKAPDGPRMMLYKGPIMDGRSRRDVGHSRNAAMT
jgi:hypothetical protein